MSTDQASVRSRWGRCRIAGRQVPAMAVAIPVGAVLAALVGAASATLRAGAPPAPSAGITAVATVGPLVALVWAIAVDRDTLVGAPEAPEQSVEARWLDRSMVGALLDTFTLSGLALAALTLTGSRLDATWALAAVIVVAAGSTGVRYLVARARG